MKIKVIDVVCLPRTVCKLTMGHDHKMSHRMIAGSVIMAIGVGIAKSTDLFESHTVHFTLDMVGYLVHGVGCTPFIEAVMAEA